MAVKHFLAEKNVAAVVITEVSDVIETEKKEMDKIVSINVSGFYPLSQLDIFLELLHKELTVNA